MADEGSNLVADHMTADVLTLGVDEAVPDAVRKLVELGVDGAPVVDAQGRLVGMLSASDVMVQDAHLHLPTIVTLFGVSVEMPGAAARYDHDIRRALASTVGELMAPDPVVIRPDATMTDAATQMHDADISRLPVVDESGHVVGIVARGDVLRSLIGTDPDRAPAGEG
jgi:CBS domain-containing protein